MQKIKEFLNKFKIWIGLLITGIVISFLVLKKHIGEGIEEHKKQLKMQEDLILDTQTKLKEETAKLEEEKRQDLKKIDTERVQKLKEAIEKAKEEKKRLSEEAKRDPQGFKIQLQKELGAREKKRKGRPKKNE